MELLDQFKQTAIKSSFQWHVGHTIFCPSCQNILDVKRAVEVDVYRDENLITSKVLCAPCYDAVAVTFTARVAELGCKVDVHDGRLLFKRPGRAPRAKKPVADVNQIPLQGVQ